MLKSTFSILLNNNFMRTLCGNIGLKNCRIENGRISLNSHFLQTYRRPIIRQIFVTHSTTNRLKEEPEEKESELITVMKRGVLLMQREQYDKAEQMLHLALKMAQDTNDADAITYIYDLLANVAFEAGHHKKAEKLFVTVMQRMLAKGEQEDSNKIVHISLKLAKIFEAMKDYRKAEQGYNFCIDALDKKLKDEDQDTLALWGMSMDWYARFLLAVGRKMDALTKLKKAYEMCVKVNGIENEQTVVLLNDLGTVSSLLGDTDAAVSYLEEARDIGKRLPEMKYLASIYVNLGQLYLLKGMYKESKISCDTGLKLGKIDENDATVEEAKNCLDMISKALKTSNPILKEHKNVLVN